MTYDDFDPKDEQVHHVFHQLKARRDDVQGYTFTIAWNYPLYAVNLRKVNKTRLDILGLESCDVGRVVEGFLGENVLVTRSKFVLLPRCYPTIADSKLRDLFTRMVVQKNNRLQVCLARP